MSIMRFLCIVLNLHNADVNECAIYSCKNRATCVMDSEPVKIVLNDNDNTGMVEKKT